MKKGVKIAIGVATVGVVGVGIYFLYKKVLKPKLDEKKRGRQGLPPQTEAIEEQPNRVVKAPTRTSVKVPFKNETEGNAFRKWINGRYPSYAREIDLDLKGSYNNSFITKAWKKYGDKYQESIKIAKQVADKKAKAIKVGDYVLVNTREKQVAYEGNPNLRKVAYFKYSAPVGFKYRVVKMGKDATNGQSMSYIFNSADKKDGFSNGRGFQIYTSKLKKTTF